VATAATKNQSIWIETGPRRPSLPRLEGEVHADVAVVGGGIVGITTALLLTEAGVDVVLLEGERLGHGVSGHTTAKVTSQHGLIYGRIRSRFGPEGARTYATANESALAWIADRIERDGIECDFRRQPAYLYMSRRSGLRTLEREAEAALEAGLPASLVEAPPLPYPVGSALRFDNQAEFHVSRYLSALVDRLQRDGCRIYEHSRATGVTSGTTQVVKTAAGAVAADRVVVATHYPFLDRSLAFARVHPTRSYVVLCRIAGDPPPGMHISGDSPTRSLRAVPAGDEQLLLVSGEGHRTGRGGDTRERYERLEEFADEHWDVHSVPFRWSTQDNVTVDGIPYVGRLTPRNDRLFMATGFAKWGMTGGTAAAMLLADLARGRDNPWAELYNPNRLKPLAAGPRLLEENVRVGFHFFGDRLRKRGTRPIDDLAPSEGDIVRAAGRKVAGHRRDDGSLVAVSTRCTHLGCQVSWNAAERSWDCPCHGSRFSPQGDVLQGPAVHPLERQPVDDRSG
jgi:glycine/D-amino acid oxidase-like deaminating enzyme/nitrite reductase/ring-hydroxylating ferredoxin subunit